MGKQFSHSVLDIVYFIKFEQYCYKTGFGNIYLFQNERFAMRFIKDALWLNYVHNMCLNKSNNDLYLCRLYGVSIARLLVLLQLVIYSFALHY